MLQEVEAGRNERKDQFDKFELAYLASDFGNGHSNFNTITKFSDNFLFYVFFKKSPELPRSPSTILLSLRLLCELREIMCDSMFNGLNVLDSVYC